MRNITSARVKSLLKRVTSEPVEHHVSYAQSGEDIIIRFVFNMLGIEQPTYLDVGAHHPSYLSNTYAFYLAGSKGVCVEPDPGLINAIRKARPRDTVLGVGVSFNNATRAKFYILSTATLSTFSEKEAKLYQEYYPGTTIEKVVDIDLIPISQIIAENFDAYPNLVSIDTEGVDFDIVKSFDFKHHPSEILCLETATYTSRDSLRKHQELIDYVRAQGYFVYADTFINTILVNKAAWKKATNVSLKGY